MRKVADTAEGARYSSVRLRPFEWDTQGCIPERGEGSRTGYRDVVVVDVAVEIWFIDTFCAERLEFLADGVRTFVGALVGAVKVEAEVSVIFDLIQTAVSAV